MNLRPLLLLCLAVILMAESTDSGLSDMLQGMAQDRKVQIKKEEADRRETERRRQETERREADLQELLPKNKRRNYTPRWVPVFADGTVCFDANGPQEPEYTVIHPESLVPSGVWKERVVPSVAKFPTEHRDILLLGLSRCELSYDRIEAAIRMRSKGRTDKSRVYISGMFSDDSSYFFAHFAYCADNWIFAKRVVVVTDGKKVEFTGIEFTRHHAGGTVWEDALLPMFDEKVFTALHDISTAKEALVRFYGEDFYSDMEVSAEEKNDLKLTLAVAAIFRGRLTPR